MLCDDCHTEVLAELILPRADWLRISPADGGFLCPSCVCIRAATLDGTVNVTGLITSADNSFEMYQAISALTAPTLPAGEWTDEQVEANESDDTLPERADPSAGPFIVYHRPTRGWWRGHAQGVTRNRDEAHIYDRLDPWVWESDTVIPVLATITPTAGGK